MSTARNWTEWRLSWRRVGWTDGHFKRKTFRSEKGARRYTLLLSGDPAAYKGEDPDDYMCCSGHECGCRGETYREYSKRCAEENGLPALDGEVLIERRSVTASEYEPASSGGKR